MLAVSGSARQEMNIMLAGSSDGGATAGWGTLLVAVVGGLAAVITSFLTTFLTGRANLRLEREKFKANEQLERQKFESSLILQMVTTGTLESATNNVEFLLDAGILSDPQGLIRKATMAGRVAVLPPKTGGEEWWSAPIRPGKFRWGVRTGSDEDASQVNASPVKTTVEKLVAEPRPPKVAESTHQNRRAEGVERTIYELEAEIITCKLESNGNFHLTLKGETGKTMIASCPEPEFVDPRSRWTKEIVAVRKQVEERLHPDRSVKPVEQRVRIRGIGLFFRLHGRIGEAPNGLELAPVLKIEWL
jgi:hypothetical protein